MRFTSKIILSCLLPLFLAGCPDSDSDTQAPSPTPTPAKEFRQIAALESQLEDARQQQEGLSQALRKSEESRGQMETDLQETVSRWRTASFVFGGGCIVTLILGAALGSKARRDGTAQ